MHLKARAVRRLFRIYPLYAMAPLVYAGLHWLQGETIERVNKHLLFDFTWETREVAFHFNPAFLRLLPEVEFYLAPPLVAALASRGGGRMVGGTAMGAVAGLMHLALELECNSRPRCLRHAVVLARIKPSASESFFGGKVTSKEAVPSCRRHPRAQFLCPWGRSRIAGSKPWQGLSKA